MMDLSQANVAVLFWRLGPYHHARLGAAGEAMRITGIEACGIEDMYGWRRVEGAEKFTKITVTEKFSANRQWARQMRQNLWRALDRLRPDVVAVPGWSMVDALAGMHWCSRTATPAVLMSDSTARSAGGYSWKEWMKSRLIKHCSSAFVAGTPHAAYLAQLGMRRDRIYLGYDVVDNEHFAARAAITREHEAEVRSQLGLPSRFFLASARFVGVKNLPRLVEAYARYRVISGRAQNGGQNSGAWSLVLLGDGPLGPALRRLIAMHGLQSSIHLPGFIQYDALPAYYALASIFVHASTSETWGLVVNEAMASGLPVLVSRGCGCVADLVQEGLNGYTFDPFDVEHLAQLMAKVAAMDTSLSDFGRASRSIVANWDLKRFAGGLKEAVRCALGSARLRPCSLDRSLLKTAMYLGSFS